MENIEKLAAALRLKIKKKKNNEVIEVIEKYGIDLVIQDIGTVLNVACLFENWELASYCIKHGADVNHRDIEESTAIIHAAKYGNKDLVELLIEAGADINVQNKYGKTALAKAISNNRTNYELIELLLQNGADSTIQENYMKDDPRVKSHNAYDYAISEIKDTKLTELLNRYK
ncbi:ankyrin repeat domain-containing protein [Chryseobacterium sp.]|uniref:ankyrin repeat domain-containing protein n=1 Tax=Chryseobacterium sp. TaxID=1871047 RepID=UPI00321BEE6E